MRDAGFFNYSLTTSKWNWTTPWEAPLVGSPTVRRRGGPDSRHSEQG